MTILQDTIAVDIHEGWEKIPPYSQKSNQIYLF